MRFCEQCLLYSAMVPPPSPSPPPQTQAPEPPAPADRASMVDILAGRTANGGPAGRRNFALPTMARKTVALGIHDEVVPGSLWATAPIQTLSAETMEELKRHFTKSLRRGMTSRGTSTVTLITGMKVFPLTLLIGFPSFPDFPDEKIEGWIASLLEIKFEKRFTDTPKQILASWPTSDEMKAIKAFKGSADDLKLTDRFFYELRDIPLLKEKFETLYLRESFDQRAEWIKITIDSAVDAVLELFASPSFGPAMVFIQVFGHANNTEQSLSDQEREKGFPVGNVVKMLEVKSFLRGIPMLEVLAHALERDRPDIAAFSSELPSLAAMSNIALAAALDDFRTLDRGLKSINTQLEADLPFRIAPRFAAPLAQHRLVLEQVRDEVTAKMVSLRKDMARFDETVASFNKLLGEPAASEFAFSVAALAKFVIEYQAIPPSDSLAIIAANAHVIPFFKKKGGLRGVARSMPTSGAVDLVAKKLNIALFEVPTGWKFFGNLMDSGEVYGKEEYTPFICGEESFGTGSNHVREKDGMWAALAWLSILAAKQTDGAKLVTVEDIVRSHWKEFGRNYYCRYDYENVDKAGAEAMFAEMTKFQNVVGKEINGFTIKVADQFAYHDPVDGSVSKNQGIRYIFEDGSRVVFRLSGTGVAGATIRMYVEKYEAPSGNLAQDAATALAPLIDVGLQLSDLVNRTGRKVPTVIT